MVTGELDQDTTAPLEMALLTAIDSSGEVSCDLNGVTFLGAAGAGAVVRAHERAQANGVAFSVRGAQGLAAEVLRIAGLGALLRPDD
jgi:anti-anti-sigma factor